MRCAKLVKLTTDFSGWMVGNIPSVYPWPSHEQCWTLRDLWGCAANRMPTRSPFERHLPNQKWASGPSQTYHVQYSNNWNNICAWSKLPLYSQGKLLQLGFPIIKSARYGVWFRSELLSALQNSHAPMSFAAFVQAIDCHYWLLCILKIRRKSLFRVLCF